MATNTQPLLLKELKRRIAGGIYREKLPSAAELAAEFSVNIKTMNKVLNQLAAAGIVERRRHSGTIVRHSDAAFENRLVEVVFSGESVKSTSSGLKIETSYVPQGFELSNPIGNSIDRYVARYQADNGQWFVIRVLDIENIQATALDNEYITHYNIEFMGQEAIWGIMKDYSNELVWSQNKYSYHISGNIGITELLKIAEGLKLE